MPPVPETLPRSVPSHAPKITLIAAVAQNGVIGIANRLPWHLPADLRHFRAMTQGHSIIMGRRNYESIGRPLPERDNIVVTRNADYVAPGCRVVRSLEQAIDVAGGDEVFVIGGAEIYRQALPIADRLVITEVHADVPGDVMFPTFPASDWHEVARERHDRDGRHAHDFSFVTYERRATASC